MSLSLPRTPGNDSNANGMLAASACAAMATLLPVAAHQVGLVKHLPDPPGGLFASDTITESASAHPLGIPDGILGLASYGVTLALVPLAKRSPGSRTLLAWKLAGDGSLAAFNVVRQVTGFRKICSWCTATALCTAAMLFAGRGLIAEEVRIARSRL